MRRFALGLGTGVIIAVAGVMAVLTALTQVPVSAAGSVGTVPGMYASGTMPMLSRNEFPARRFAFVMV